MEYLASNNAKEITLQAIIIRADGSKEDLGVVSYWNKNIFKILLWKAKKWLRF